MSKAIWLEGELVCDMCGFFATPGKTCPVCGEGVEYEVDAYGDVNYSLDANGDFNLFVDGSWKD